MLLVLVAGWGGFGGARGAPAATGRAAAPAEQEVDRLLNAGADAYTKEDFAAAEAALRAALEGATRLGDRHRMAQSLNNLGLVYWRTGRLEPARAYLTRALEIYEVEKDRLAVAKALDNLGLVSKAMGDLDAALDFHTRALKAYEELGNKRKIAGARDNLALVHRSLGHFDQARELHLQAIAMFQALGEKEELASAYLNIGILYQRTGQFRKAVDVDTRAIALFQALGRKQSTAYGLDNLGGVYQLLGQFSQARFLHTRALNLFERLGNPWDRAAALGNLGGVCQRVGDLDSALRYFRLALQAFEGLGDADETARTLRNVGLVLDLQKQPEAAAECFERALRMSETRGNTQEIANSYHNLGAAYYDLGRWDEALAHFRRALALRRGIGNRLEIAESLRNVGIVLEKQGHLAEAEGAWQEALTHYEAISAEVDNPARVGAFQEAHPSSLYAYYARLLAQQGHPVEALAMAERGRTRGLARQTAQSGVDLSRFVAPEEAGRLQALTAAMTRAGRSLYALAGRSRPTEGAARNAFDSELAQARQGYEAAERQLSVLRDGLAARHPDYGRIQAAPPPTAAQLTELAHQNADTLYLEWVIVDARTTLLFALSDREGVQVFNLSHGKQELAEQTRGWRDTIIDGRGEERGQAAAVFRAVLDPVEKAGLLAPGRYAHLVLVGDGPLLGLPWAALIDGGGKRLMEREPLATAVSLGALTWEASRRQPTGTLLCAADPAGGSGGKGGKASMSGASALRYARVQSSEVVKLLGGSTKVLVGPEAREATVKGQMGRYAVLHFATHGFAESVEGLRSWLLLAPEPLQSAEDGRLEAREIAGIPLAAQLAVLSACETGRGEVLGGEGLLGLAWAFRAAGCPSVVASLWDVDDAATAALMVAFYRGLQAGVRKDAALRDAMLSVRKTYVGPRLWAGFQVIGDTSPLSLPGAPAKARRYGTEELSTTDRRVGNIGSPSPSTLSGGWGRRDQEMDPSIDLQRGCRFDGSNRSWRTYIAI
jgi:CHAT domain-containing protein/tetratricopeptide (TPR) repeat protein